MSLFNINEHYEQDHKCEVRFKFAKKMSTMAGLEPAIPRSEVWCLIHLGHMATLISESQRGQV